MIQLRQAQIGYSDKLVLQNISLDIAPGERVAIVGPSGAGKSTLIRLLYQASQPHRTALVPQRANLVPNLSVFHNVYIGRLSKSSLMVNLRNFIAPSLQARQAIEQILHNLGIEQYIFTPVQNLSGGQQQRVSIARAIYEVGDLILADEPVSAVDEHLARKLLRVIGESWKTAVVVLHDLKLAKSYTDRVIGLNHGAIVFDKPVSELSADDLL